MDAKERLSSNDFLAMGLEILAEQGPGSMTATRLASELGVTTGSFYWHFKSVPEFHGALCEYWKDEVVVGVAREAQKLAAGDPAKLLEALGQVILRNNTHRFDTAMRNWAMTNADVARIVAAADQWRQETMTGFLSTTGTPENSARDHINLIGAAWRGTAGTDPEYRIKLAGLATPKD